MIFFSFMFDQAVSCFRLKQKINFLNNKLYGSQKLHDGDNDQHLRKLFHLTF